MDSFAYLYGITSVVLGLGLTRLFVGIGTAVEHRKTVSPYWVHMLWALNLFLFITLEWWIRFRWHTHQEWNFFLFIFLLLSPSISFLLSVILFPSTIADTYFKKHFYQNHRWFFSIAALLTPLDAVDTLLKGYTHFQNQGTIYPVFLSVVFILTVLAAILKSERYHQFFAIFFLLCMVGFIYVNLNKLT
jgi:hypothetical protein